MQSDRTKSLAKILGPGRVSKAEALVLLIYCLLLFPLFQGFSCAFSPCFSSPEPKAHG